MAQRTGADTMIDHLDKQTTTLPLEQKRGRGRPATGQALSNAERQRRYREAQKAQRNEKPKGGVAWEDARALMTKIDELTANLAKALERAEMAEVELEAMSKKLAKAEAKAAKAGPTKRRYVLQYRYVDAYGEHWQDDSTGDFGSKKEAEEMCRMMNKPDATKWRVRERQWV